MSAQWRPLVGIGVLPWWVRLRDVLLTLLAWLALLWLMRHLRAALRIAAYHLAGVPLDARVLQWVPRPDIFLPFAAAAVLLMLGAVLIALARRRSLKAQPRAFPEPQLDASAHAARFGLDAGQMAQLRAGAVRTVQFEGVGRIAAIAPAAQAAPPTGT